jgi:hypothetical protein
LYHTNLHNLQIGYQGKMMAIPKNVDMVFSGQNVEHLWANELAGFLSEANRVLEQDGLLVVDSPNFPVCQTYGWSHPEHITELSVPQITRLLGISGFRVEQCFGLWDCYLNGKLLPLDPSQDRSSFFSYILVRLKIFNGFSIRKRISIGLKNPETAFV